MGEMIVVGAFTLGGFFLGAIVALVGVISARQGSEKSEDPKVVNDRIV